MTVVALLSDLFFSARIRETAKQLGVTLDVVRDPAELAGRAVGVDLVLVDCNLKTGDALGAVRGLRASDATRDVPVVGYLFDSQIELIGEAKAAGCDRIFSRGGLTKVLPRLLAGEIPVGSACH